MRMLVYELLALFPASVIVIPYETVRDRIKSGDVSLFTDGSGKRIALGYALPRTMQRFLYESHSVTIGAFLTPVFFAAVFRTRLYDSAPLLTFTVVIKREHVAFMLQRLHASNILSSTTLVRLDLIE